MYVHFSLSRMVSSPTTRHSNNHAIKMHSTLQSQHKSNKSPLSQHISMDKSCFLKALCIFRTSTKHISHAEISIVTSRQARFISTPLSSSIYAIILSNSDLSPFNMYSSTPSSPCIAFCLHHAYEPAITQMLAQLLSLRAHVSVTLTQPHTTPTIHRAPIHASIVH